MKTKRLLRTREELLALEDKYFGGGLGNLLSLGAAHFRRSNRKTGPRARSNNALPGAKPWLPDMKRADGDRALQEIWRIKDSLSVAFRHNVDRLFADARKRQKLSAHPAVNLQQGKSSRRKS